MADRSTRADNIDPPLEGGGDASHPFSGDPSTIPEPPVDPESNPFGFADNPLNPRGIPSNMTNGYPNAQATDAQKTQDPTPARIPIAADMFPDPNPERVSAGQNRKPPLEQIPVIAWLLLVPALIEPLL
jgi:hypothetical protein